MMKRKLLLIKGKTNQGLYRSYCLKNLYKKRKKIERKIEKRAGGKAELFVLLDLGMRA